MNNWGPYAVIMLCSALGAAFSQILLKKSTLKEHKSNISYYFNIRVISAYSILSLTLIANVFAFTKVPFKFGSILMSSSYIFTLVLSSMLLKAQNTWQAIVGNIIILIGIIVYSMDMA